VGRTITDTGATATWKEQNNTRNIQALPQISGTIKEKVKFLCLTKH
jgi:hypothetical protein